MIVTLQQEEEDDEGINRNKIDYSIHSTLSESAARCFCYDII
jgi:hypothetical protein